MPHDILDPNKEVREAVFRIHGATNFARQLFKLGSVAFHGFEAPQDLAIPHKQITAVHEFVGGGRSVQTLGSQPSAIQWSGKLVPQHQFLNAQVEILYREQLDPVQRAIDIQLMHDRGEPVTLVFGRLRWSVVITDYTFSIVNIAEVNYSLSIVVVDDFVSIDPDPAAFAPLIGSVSSNSILIALAARLTKASDLIDILEQAEIFTIVAVEAAIALQNSSASLAALGALIAGETTLAAVQRNTGLFSGFSLIAIANDIAHTAALVKTLARSVVED